jgi:pyruvate/2-oxoacid:ferredoxin oxidoreductase beta subunit
MKQEDEQAKNDPPKKEQQSVPSLKERIEQLKEHNEFLEDPAKEKITKPEEEEEGE